MSRSDLDALVIGAGVSGLTTAVCLAEAGMRVTIWAAEPPERTTSYAAGAMWGSYHVEPVDRVRLWSAQTLEVLRQLATDARTGVRLVPGVEASHKPVDPPEWRNQFDGFRMCEASELPDGFAAGWRYTALTVNMPVYLGYLRRRLGAALVLSVGAVTGVLHGIGVVAVIGAADQMAAVAVVVAGAAAGLLTGGLAVVVQTVTDASATALEQVAVLLGVVAAVMTVVRSPVSAVPAWVGPWGWPQAAADGRGGPWVVGAVVVALVVAAAAVWRLDRLPQRRLAAGSTWGPSPARGW